MSETAASVASAAVPAPKRRRRRWWLAAAVVVVAVVVVALVLTRGPAPGSDNHAIGTPYTDNLTAGNPVGTPVTFGTMLIYNQSDTPLTLVSAEPVKMTPGLQVLGILAAGADRPLTDGIVHEYPPSGYKVTTRPLAGTVIPPVNQDAGQHRAGTEIIVGVKSPKPGQFNLEGLKVRYRQHGTVYATTLGYRFSICNQTGTIHKCPIPAAWKAGGQTG